ncbi:MAG: bacillithiol biosynthesis cysteine-adding enzyme BshC [Chitinophagales bacterium]|nr:bacillithiol biosynthesis cysteine-adding enzyme BshC [Chitinophagales bacterium]
MMIEHLSFAQTNQLASSVIDYIENKSSIQSILPNTFGLDSLPNIIQTKQNNFLLDRSQLVQEILNQYNNFSTTDTIQQNINLLENNNCFAVVAAHQLNIFTGPFYYLYKIISTINTCKLYNEKFTSYQFVPIFWLGSEDHDFDEINHTTVFGKDIAWQNQQKGAMGNYSTVGIDACIAEIKTILGDLPFANEVIDLFEKAYAKENLAQATRYLLNELFGNDGLVIVDGNTNFFKQQFKTVMKEELLHQSSKALVEQQNEILQANNYKTQAYARAINLFFVDENGRNRIELDNHQYQIVDTNLIFSKDAIIHELDNYPEKFSPNVILRPLFQQQVLPAVAFVGGAGELQYWMQLPKVFEHYQIPFPQLILRNSVLWINKYQYEKMNKLNISIEEIFKREDDLIKQFVQHKQEDLQLDEEKALLSRIFKIIQQKTNAIDSAMQSFVEAEQQKQIKAIENIEKKFSKAIKSQNETAINQIAKLKEQLFPNGILQERVENFSSEYAKYGKKTIALLKEQLYPYQNEFVVIITD